jgi:hypothetical protein
VKLNKQLRKNQLENKMIKDNGDDNGKAEDMGVINQGRENPLRTMQNELAHKKALQIGHFYMCH